LKKIIYVNYLVQILTLAINFIYSLILVNQLGAGGYGDYVIFYNSLAFSVLFLGFNLPSVIIYFLANKKIDKVKLLYSCLFFICIMTSLLVVFLFNTGKMGVADFIFPNGNSKALWIFFFSAQFFLLLLNQVLSSFLNVEKIFIPLLVFGLFTSLSLLGFWLLIQFKIFNLTISMFDLIWWSSIVINLCIAAYSIYLIKSKMYLQPFSRLLNYKELRLLKNFVFIVYLCNTIQFLNYKMDLFFINQYWQKNDVGFYALALSISQLVWVLPNAISNVLLNYFQVEQRDKSIHLALKAGQITFYFSLICALLLAITSYYLLPIFYGPEFYKVYQLCLVLFMGTIPFSLSIILANLNSGIGFIRLNLYATIFCFLAGLVLDIVIIPAYGVFGAAYVKVIISVAGLLFQIFYAKKLYKLPWTSLFRFGDFNSLIPLNFKS
jgi:O-antigen/teichoic acid export membrane protein